MSVLNYFERQKEKILKNHLGDRVKDVRSAYDILAEIDALKGLNTRERLAARSAALASQSKSTCLSSFQ